MGEYASKIALKVGRIYPSEDSVYLRFEPVDIISIKPVKQGPFPPSQRKELLLLPVEEDVPKKEECFLKRAFRKYFRKRKNIQEGKLIKKIGKLSPDTLKRVKRDYDRNNLD